MNKTIPKRTVTISTVAGADPDAIEDAHNVYEDGLVFDLAHLEGEHCERSASGKHSYIVSGGSYVCICCGADGGEV